MKSSMNLILGLIDLFNEEERFVLGCTNFKTDISYFLF